MNRKGGWSALLRFLAPGRAGTGFLMGVGFMLWLAVEKKIIFDEMVLFVLELLQLIQG